MSIVIVGAGPNLGAAVARRFGVTAYPSASSRRGPRVLAAAGARVHEADPRDHRRRRPRPARVQRSRRSRRRDDRDRTDARAGLRHDPLHDRRRGDQLAPARSGHGNLLRRRGPRSRSGACTSATRSPAGSPREPTTSPMTSPKSSGAITPTDACFRQGSASTHPGGAGSHQLRRIVDSDEHLQRAEAAPPSKPPCR
jgi:hypothetical protein